jgi:IS1 family transposase
VNEQSSISDQDTTPDDAAFADLIGTLQTLVTDPELKTLLDQLAVLPESPPVPESGTSTSSGPSALAAKYADAILAYMKSEADKELDDIDTTLKTFEAGLAAIDIPPPTRNAATDAAAYQRYYAQVEAALSSAFGFDFRGSTDPKAVAWRDFKQQLATQTSADALEKRYATTSTLSTLVGEGLSSKIRDALIQRTGLSGRQLALGNQSDKATTILRLTAGLRNSTNLMRLVTVLTSADTTQADKDRAIAEIVQSSTSVVQVVVGMAISAWPSVSNQIVPVTTVPGAGGTTDALSTAKKTQEMLKSTLANLQGAFKLQSPVNELFTEVSIRATAVSAADLAKLAKFTEANVLANKRAGDRVKTLGKAGLSLVANAAALGADVTKMANPHDLVDVGQTVVDFAGNGVQVFGDLVKVIGNSTTAAQIASRLGVAGAALGTVSACIGLIDSLVELGQNPQSELAKWNVANAAVQIVGASIAVVAAVVYPPAALVTLLFPNFSAIGQAIEYVTLMEEYEKRRLMHEYAVLNELHTKAALDASPVVNWFGAVYAPAIEGGMRAKMTTEWFWEAYMERVQNIFKNQFTDEEKARFAALQKLCSDTGATELIDIVYDKEEFSWLDSSKKLFGTAMTTYTADGRDASFDKIWRGNAMVAERSGATRDGEIDRTVLLQRNFDNDEILPADQPMSDETKTRLVEDSSWAVDGFPVTQWIEEAYLDPVNAPVAKGLSVELKLDGDNLVILQASDTAVYSTGESNDTYRVADGVNYTIADDFGDADRVIFDAGANGRTFKLQASGIEVYYGSAFDDQVVGSDRDDIFDDGTKLYTNGGGDDVVALNGGDDLAVVGGHAANVDLGGGNDAAYLSALGATISGGSDQDAVYLTDAVALPVTGGTKVGDDGNIVIELAELQSDTAPVPWLSRMTGIESLTLTRQDDVFDIAAGTQGTEGAADGLCVLDASAGNDTVRSLASGVVILAGDGDDSVTIGSNEFDGAIADAYVDTGAGIDTVVVEGNVAATIVLNGEDLVAAAGQVCGSLDIEAGSGNACVEIGTADTILHFDKEDEGTLTVIDGQGRAAVLDEVVFDFSAWSAGDLAVGMGYDEFGAARYSIATSGQVRVQFSSDDASRTWIEAGDEAYSMSAAITSSRGRWRCPARRRQT